MSEEKIQKGNRDSYKCLGCQSLWGIDDLETFVAGGNTKYICKKCSGNCVLQPDINDKEIQGENEVLYHCLECHGLWGDEGVDTFIVAGNPKHICKECRGACLVKDDLKKRTGVKSIKQKFRKSKIGWYILLLFVCYGAFWFFQNVVTINDYRNYLIETADIRKKINSKLHNFKKDHITIKNKKASFSDKRQAEYRINSTKRYILSFSEYVEKMNTPEKPEIVKLYTLEKNFWTTPTYENYLNYSSTFDDLKNRYDLEYFEYVKDIVRKKLVDINKSKIKTK